MTKNMRDVFGRRVSVMRCLIGQQPSELKHSSVLHRHDLDDLLQRLLAIRMALDLELAELMVLDLAELLQH